MQPMGILIDLQAARAAQAAANDRESDILAEYAGHLDGVTPEEFRHVLDAQRVTLQTLESRLSRYRDVAEAVRAMWSAWHSPAGREVTADEALRKIPGVPASLLEPSARQALATKCHEVMRRLATEYDPQSHGGRLILGRSGCGKSLGLAQAAFRLALGGRRGTYWTTAARLVEGRRKHPLGSGECPPVENAIRASWLILDEMGWERGDSGAVLDVLSARYDAGRVVCVTSGLTEKEFVAKYGDAVVRRVTESNRKLPGKTLDLHPAK